VGEDPDWIAYEQSGCKGSFSEFCTERAGGYVWYSSSDVSDEEDMFVGVHSEDQEDNEVEISEPAKTCKKVATVKEYQDFSPEGTRKRMKQILQSNREEHSRSRQALLEQYESSDEDSDMNIPYIVGFLEQGVPGVISFSDYQAQEQDPDFALGEIGYMTYVMKCHEKFRLEQGESSEFCSGKKNKGGANQRPALLSILQRLLVL